MGTELQICVYGHLDGTVAFYVGNEFFAQEDAKYFPNLIYFFAEVKTIYEFEAVDV